MKRLLFCFLTFLSHLSSEEQIIKTSWWWPWSDSPPPKGFDLSRTANLEQILSEKVVGQPSAIKLISNAMLAYLAQIHDTKRPIGCFLFIGSSGVGKTELAKALANTITFDADQFIHLNMSEMQSEEGLNRLIGMGWGYINNEKGGELSNAIRKSPYSVVLLDEFEKCGEKVRLLFLQIFDEGFFKTAKGEHIDCRNCIFIATTNIGSKQIEMLYSDYSCSEEILHLIKPHLTAALTPELYNRMEPVVFQKINTHGLLEIIRLKLKDVSNRIYENRRIQIHFDDSVINYIHTKCLDLNSGARSILNIIKTNILPFIAKSIIDDIYKENDRLSLSYDQNALTLSRLS